MTHVLHLMSVDRDFQSWRCAENLQCGLGAGFSVKVQRIGAGGDYRHAISAGLALRGARNGRAESEHRAQIIHAWSPTALIAAAIAKPQRIVYSVPPEFDSRDLRWIGPILRRPSTEIVFPTRALHRQYATRGIPVQRCSIISPGVDVTAGRTQRRTSLREELGFSNSQYIILAPGESTRASAHRDAVWAAAILNCMDSRYRIVVWGKGPQFPAVARFAERLGQPGFFISAAQTLGREVEFEELLSVADAAIVAGHGTLPTLPIAMCMSAGLPIASAVNATLCELLADQQTALMAPRATPRTLAQRILDLQADKNLQRDLGVTSREHAAEFFSLSGFLEKWRKIYANVESRVNVGWVYSPTE
jgi:glycosyltransferase involved in cell wall biosynthesis